MINLVQKISVIFLWTGITKVKNRRINQRRKLKLQTAKEGML